MAIGMRCRRIRVWPSKVGSKVSLSTSNSLFHSTLQMLRYIREDRVTPIYDRKRLTHPYLLSPPLVDQIEYLNLISNMSFCFRSFEQRNVAGPDSEVVSVSEKQ